jgi:hypothetical protein
MTRAVRNPHMKNQQDERQTLEDMITNYEKAGDVDSADDLRELVERKYGRTETEQLTLASIKAMDRPTMDANRERVEAFLSGKSSSPALDLTAITTTADLKRISREQWIAMGEDGRDALLAKVQGRAS